MTLDSLTGLLVEELRDVYDAEQQLIKALPKMSKAAFNEEVSEAFNLHTEQTREHVARLERVFGRFREKPKGKPCDGMKGIIAEAEKLLAEEPKADPSILDAALIASAQRAEHYEIATYGALHSYTQTAISINPSRECDQGKQILYRKSTGKLLRHGLDRGSIPGRSSGRAKEW